MKPMVAQWDKTCDWFMKRTHDSGVVDRAINQVELQKKFDLFESTLLAIIRGYSTFFANTPEIDKCLCLDPTDANVEYTVALLGHAEYHRYFFDKLNNPAWIKPLKKKGFLTSPPQSIRGTEHIGFLVWPESRFLVRMAKLDPEAVAEIFPLISDTDNIRVHDDLVDIALSLPAESAIKLIPRVKKWLAGPIHILFPNRFFALVEKLVEAGKINQALQLARILLQVIPERTPNLIPDTRPLLDQWHYEQFLNQSFPMLVGQAGMPALKLLCQILASAIEYAQERKEFKTDEDYSWIWRPVINQPNPAHGVTDTLVTAVCAAVQQLLDQDLVSVEVVIEYLEKQNWNIFHRIALHILNLYGTRAGALLSGHLCDPQRFDHLGISDEYWQAVRQHFPSLSDDDKKIVLEWLGTNPDRERVKSRLECSDEDAATYVAEVQRDRLALLEAHLPDPWKGRYQALIARLGSQQPRPPAFPISFGRDWLRSPKTADELAEMPIPELIEYLKAWQPPREPFGESVAGLGSKLAEAVRTSPMRFAAEAHQFNGLPPAYVREFLWGLCEAVRSEIGFDWTKVLSLGEWVAQKDTQVPSATPSFWDQDVGWAGCKNITLELLSLGFDRKSIPISLRASTWAILEHSLQDPHPTVADESPDIHNGIDPYALFKNWPRSAALSTVISYALWCSSDHTKPSKTGIAELSEVLHALERHLDTKFDSSLVVRSVYGFCVPHLRRIDQEWLARNIHNIFPEQQDLLRYRASAWTAYITRYRFNLDLFPILMAEYRWAAENPAEVLTNKARMVDPSEALAAHLMSAYWFGAIDIAQPDNLLTSFYENASESVRTKATQIIGRSLRGKDETLPASIVKRVQALWLWRLKVGQTDSSGMLEELAWTGWWFASGRFGDRWALERLLETLQLTKRIEPDYEVVKRLAQVSEQMPREAVQCLALIVEGDDAYRVLGWEAQAKTILHTATTSSDAEARVAAVGLIHKLGSRGFTDFGHLLVIDSTS